MISVLQSLQGLSVDMSWRIPTDPHQAMRTIAVNMERLAQADTARRVLPLMEAALGNARHVTATTALHLFDNADPILQKPPHYIRPDDHPTYHKLTPSLQKYLHVLPRSGILPTAQAARSSATSRLRSHPHRTTTSTWHHLDSVTLAASDAFHCGSSITTSDVARLLDGLNVVPRVHPDVRAFLDSHGIDTDGAESPVDASNVIALCRLLVKLYGRQGLYRSAAVSTKTSTHNLSASISPAETTPPLLANPPPPTDTSPCRQHRRGYCSWGEACKYSHEDHTGEWNIPAAVIDSGAEGTYIDLTTLSLLPLNHSYARRSCDVTLQFGTSDIHASSEVLAPTKWGWVWFVVLPPNQHLPPALVGRPVLRAINACLDFAAGENGALLTPTDVTMLGSDQWGHMTDTCLVHPHAAPPHTVFTCN